MYAKIFNQIFDSSIAEDYQVRHVFEDLLKLANIEGVVDMTIEAIARRTNVPIEIIRHGINELSKPDPRSRTKDFEGRRIILIDKHRDWGWIIVNYDYYRALQDEEARRKTYRESKRRQRAKEKAKTTLKKGTPIPGETTAVKLYEMGAIDENGQPLPKDQNDDDNDGLPKNL